MMLSKKVEGKDIKFNISSSVRMYTEGLSILDTKQTVLDEIKSQYKRKYIQDYTNREERIMKEIRDMEENPYSYQDLMGPFTNDTNAFHRVTKIDVHEDIPKLPENFMVIFEGIFNYIEGVITKEKELLQKIKESIEGLFEEDERIAETIFGAGR